MPAHARPLPGVLIVVLPCLVGLVLAGCSSLQDRATSDSPGSFSPSAPSALSRARPDQPEAATGRTERKLVRASRQMVATANPHASLAALGILRAGGSAADAAIAAQWVLGLVEPQSSGLGGGTLLLHHDAATMRTIALDGRETAPAGAREDLFLDASGKPVSFERAVVGGRSVGVPGTVAALAELHQRHGRLPWRELTEPAIRLARDGFEVSPRLNGLLARESLLKLDPVARAYFYDDRGAPRAVGHRLRNPDYAATLQQIAEEGAAAFYRGRIASAIAAKARGHPDNPGTLAESDLAGYRTIARDPVCGPWLRYVVCGMPPPSSGGIAVLQILLLLEQAAQRGPIHLHGAQGPRALAIHRFSEAARLAYADRAEYIADPAFSDWPRGLLDGSYLIARARLLTDDHSLGEAVAGQPPGATAAPRAQAAEYEESGTTHLSVSDSAGNVVAMTSTIESAFGSRQMVAGFLLNHELTDFAIEPRQGGRAVANRVEPGKRPRSSMSPTIVFERRPDGGAGDWILSVGSPGGSQIITYVARVMMAVLADGHDIQSAIDQPNFGSRNGPTELEAGRFSPVVISELRALGHEVRETELTSGLHGILRVCRRPGERSSCILSGGADSRREGLVLGD